MINPFTIISNGAVLYNESTHLLVITFPSALEQISCRTIAIDATDPDIEATLQTFHGRQSENIPYFNFSRTF